MTHRKQCDGSNFIGSDGTKVDDSDLRFIEEHLLENRKRLAINEFLSPQFGLYLLTLTTRTRNWRRLLDKKNVEHTSNDDSNHDDSPA